MRNHAPSAPISRRVVMDVPSAKVTTGRPSPRGRAATALRFHCSVPSASELNSRSRKRPRSTLGTRAAAVVVLGHADRAVGRHNPHGLSTGQHQFLELLKQVGGTQRDALFVSVVPGVVTLAIDAAMVSV